MYMYKHRFDNRNTWQRVAISLRLAVPTRTGIVKLHLLVSINYLDKIRLHILCFICQLPSKPQQNEYDVKY
jgi:hypothetical protein